MNGLQTHTLDFEILPTSNTKSIIFLDSSKYFGNPESPILNVYLPGFNKFFTVDIEFGRINTFNSNTIGLTSILESNCPVEFQDGVYTFDYRVCPYNHFSIEKTILRTVILDNQLKKIYTLINLDKCDSLLKKDLLEIHILIESAKANAELGLNTKAIKEYSIAQKKVKSILDKL